MRGLSREETYHESILLSRCSGNRPFPTHAPLWLTGAVEAAKLTWNQSCVHDFLFSHSRHQRDLVPELLFGIRRFEKLAGSFPSYISGSLYQTASRSCRRDRECCSPSGRR